jgi:hypothetical protein
MPSLALDGDAKDADGRERRTVRPRVLPAARGDVVDEPLAVDDATDDGVAGRTRLDREVAVDEEELASRALTSSPRAMPTMPRTKWPETGTSSRGSS